MSRLYCDDHESDDDKVVYIDNDDTNTISTNNFNIKSINKTIRNKRKSLFQYRRLKDDTEKDDDIMKIKKTIDLQGIHSILNNIRGPQYIEVGAVNDDYADSPVIKNVKFPLDNTNSYQIDKKNLKPSEHHNDLNSLLPTNTSKLYNESNKSSNHIIHNIIKPINGPMKIKSVTPHYDVAMDRPSHWNKVGINKPFTQSTILNKTSAIKQTNNSLLMNKILNKHMNTSTNKKILKQSTRNNINTQVSTVLASLNDIDKLCFKPSWMIDNEAATNNNRNNNMTNHTNKNKHYDELTEQIQEECEDFLDDNTNLTTNNNYSNNNNNNTYITDSYTPKKTNILSPNTYHTNDNNSNNSITKSYHHNQLGMNFSNYKPSKAKPGTLKAKLFKILRELDAAETWIINIPSRTKLTHTATTTTNNSNMIDHNKLMDLQDPRNRASYYIDFEYLTKLPDQYPFQVCLLRVLDHHIVSKKSTNYHIYNHMINENESIIERNEYHHNEYIIAFNTEIKAYFKSNDAMISNRNLYDGMHLRIYEPSIVSLPINTNSDNNNNNNNQTNELVLLCTNCWESIS